MANIPFPAVSLSSVSCELYWPGQIVHEGIYSGEMQAISRGIGRWRGSFNWQERSRSNQQAEIRAISAFFSNLEGSVNTFDLPIPVDRLQANAFPDSANVRLMSVLRTGSTMRVQINQQSGFQIGHRLTIDNQLFECVTPLLSGFVTLSPFRPLVPGDDGLPVKWIEPTVRARLSASQSPTAVHTNDWVGPWDAEFISVG